MYERNLAQAHESNSTVLTVVHGLRKTYDDSAKQCQESDKPKDWTLNRMLYANAQRMYGIGLFAACYTNALLRTLSPPDTCLELRESARVLALEIVKLAEEAMPLRPMATAFVLLCLLVAWACTTDVALQSQIEDLYKQYSCDHANERHAPWDKDGYMTQCILDSGLMVPDSSYSP